SGNVVIGQSDRGSIEVIPGSHGPLISDALTRAAGLRLATFVPQGPRRNLPRSYPLTGLLYCSRCGLAMRGMGFAERMYGWTHACEEGSKHFWAADPIEREVREYLARLTPPAEVLAHAEASAAVALAATTGQDHGAELARVDAALDRLADLYADGQIDRDRYLRKKLEYEARRPAGHGAGVSGVVVPPIGDAIRNGPPLLLRDVARMLIERITIGPEGPTIALQAWCAGWGP
ncbi:MAG TPA: hypothetical protein PK954_11950, partial [Anaerolineales bacterium]|nr:hypothetical protein [Anaerolineales bacterium]